MQHLVECSRKLQSIALHCSSIHITWLISLREISRNYLFVATLYNYKWESDPQSWRSPKQFRIWQITNLHLHTSVGHWNRWAMKLHVTSKEIIVGSLLPYRNVWVTINYVLIRGWLPLMEWFLACPWCVALWLSW